MYGFTLMKSNSGRFDQLRRERSRWIMNKLRKSSKAHIAILLVISLLLSTFTVIASDTDDTMTRTYEQQEAVMSVDEALNITEITEGDIDTVPTHNTQDRTNAVEHPDTVLTEAEAFEDIEESDEQCEEEFDLEEELSIPELLAGEYVEGELLVVVPKTYNLDDVVELFEEFDTVDEEELSNSDQITDTLFVATLHEDTTVAEAIAEMQAHEDVLHVQPNYIYRTMDEPTEAGQEELLEALTTLTNDPGTDQQWANLTTRIYDTWSLMRTNGRVAIAIFDTGTRTTHQDLAANIIPGSFFDVTSSRNPGGASGDPYNPNIDGHGTHVAGVAAASSNNGLGISGVSFNARIVPIKIFNDSGQAFTVNLVDAFNRLLTRQSNGMTLAQMHNIKVINLSIGTTGIDTAVQNVVNQAFNAGILTIAAAGNNANSVPLYPASFPNVMSVSSLRRGANGSVLSDVFDTSYSNFGNTIDVSAPGSRIYSTSNNADNAYSFVSGTSFAAPFVSGVAAMMFAANPNATPEQVRNIIQNTAEDLGAPGKDPYYGWGQVNPYAAVWAIASKSIVFSSASGVGKPINCTVSTSLSQTMQWNWWVSPSDGSITSNGVLTPSRSGNITVRASYALDPSLSITGVVNVPYNTPGLTLISEAHVQNIGWMAPVANGGVLGTFGRSLRVETLRLTLVNTTGFSGGISYQTHVQNIGWQAPVVLQTPGNTTQVYRGGNAGTTGQGLRMESFTMNLTGELANHYDIYYRAHVQNIGWMGWAKNGNYAVGSAGLSLRMEALQILVILKGSSPPGDTYNGVTSPAGAPCFVDATSAGLRGAVNYGGFVHVQNVGNLNFSRVNGSSFIGTMGRGLRLEAMSLNLENPPVSGNISYEVHVQNIGWQGVRSAGQMAGTSGRSLRLEAIRVNLTGAMAQEYDIYYRTHVQNFGWMGWARNGQSAGSAGYSYRMEAIQIVIVPKGTIAPGLNSGFFAQQ